MNGGAFLEHHDYVFPKPGVRGSSPLRDATFLTISGVRTSIAGLFVALVILQVISSGFNIIKLSPLLALACRGLILLLVMAIKRVSRTVS